jgi:hypothetical protein
MRLIFPFLYQFYYCLRLKHVVMFTHMYVRRTYNLQFINAIVLYLHSDLHFVDALIMKRIKDVEIELL